MSFTTVNVNLFPDPTFTPPTVQLSKKISRKTEVGDWTFAKRELNKRKGNANARVQYFERQLQKLESVVGPGSASLMSAAVVTSRREKTSFEHKKKDNKRGSSITATTATTSTIKIETH
ncbi:6_t:CDS:1, partial [Ambispora leptoticha]